MTSPFASTASPTPPYLEHYPDPGGPPHRIVLDPLPFRIGRSPTAQHIIYSRQVSKEHSEIFRVGKEFRIRDLGSTNGTFVNGQRVGEAPLVNGDIIHIAHSEFRFGCQLENAANETSDNLGLSQTETSRSDLPTSIIRSSRHLKDLLEQQAARVVFQPIVHLDTRRLAGYETLGRGNHPELSASPGDLFRLAGQCKLEVDLSRLFRTMAVREAVRLPENIYLFFNVHPAEMGSPDLLESLRELKAAMRGSRRPVLEVHEGLVTDLPSMRRLREQLKHLDIGLAYDDFGAGQSRLNELAEVPPDFIKLDMSLIRGIDMAGARQDLVRALNRVTRDLGVQTIAEGIETEEEAQVCRSLGCQLGQGYLLGRPQSSPALLTPEAQPTALAEHGSSGIC
ncbi:MAG: EAL domain-containing protein [Planctomycetes bacterium]|nr:EAL domain-containing protein [Planctomycetota bacterium]